MPNQNSSGQPITAPRKVNYIFRKLFSLVPKLSMMCCMKSLNTKGFSSQISRGQLPSSDHITYQGVFNQLTFQVGQKTNKFMDLHVGFCRAGNKHSSTDKQVHEFLAMFLKSKYDGEARDHRKLNAVIVLDISGSMGGGLRGSTPGQSRLELSKQAIKMFVSKLRPDDAFGLVIFDDKGETVVPCTRKSDIEVEAVFAMVDQIKTRGGTTLSSGFNEGVKTLNGYLEKCAKSEGGCENRIVMLTDVGDNSLSTEQNFIEKVSQEDIHVTIIGISDEFRSSTCEKLSNVKGFNYFCAVENSDLKKYLFENFDFTFLPCAYDIEVTLESEDVKYFNVYGTSDSEDVKKYNNFAVKGNKKFIITKTKTCFPSELEIKDGTIHMHGGLILVELSPQPNMKSFSGRLTVTSKTVRKEVDEQHFDLKYDFPPNEQFFSEKCLEEAISGFFFVHEIKQIIKDMKTTLEKKVTEQNKKKYLEALRSIRSTAPECKIKEVDDMIKLVEKLHVAKPGPSNEEDDFEERLKEL